MCGRSITAHAAAFERAIRLGKISCQFERSYNVAPTLSVPVVRVSTRLSAPVSETPWAERSPVSR
jgi:hypothetical protein